MIEWRLRSPETERHFNNGRSRRQDCRWIPSGEADRLGTEPEDLAWAIRMRPSVPLAASVENRPSDPVVHVEERLPMYQGACLV
jgi:hypothetical protein